MEDFSQYSCNNLIEYIVDECKQHNEGRDFASYLLSMREAESIEELITIFDNIFKLLAVFFYGSNKDLPRNWYQYEFWGRDASNRVKELYGFLNENILSWLKRQENPTPEQCKACLLNLRECDNREIIEAEIIEIAGEDVEKDTSSNRKLRTIHSDLRLLLNKISCQDVDYIRSMGQFRGYSSIIAYNGHIFDVVEKAFAKQYNIDFDDLYSKYIDNLESQRKKEVFENEIEKERNKGKRKRIVIIYGHLSIMGILLLFFSDLTILIKILSITPVLVFLIWLIYIWPRNNKQYDVQKEERISNFLDIISALLIFIIIVAISGYLILKIGIIGIIVIIGLIGLIPSFILRGKM